MMLVVELKKPLNSSTRKKGFSVSYAMPEEEDESSSPCLHNPNAGLIFLLSRNKNKNPPQKPATPTNTTTQTKKKNITKKKKKQNKNKNKKPKINTNKIMVY
jgi:outer membrane biosynthesis protein TonB